MLTTLKFGQVNFCIKRNVIYFPCIDSQTQSGRKLRLGKGLVTPEWHDKAKAAKTFKELPKITPYDLYAQIVNVFNP